MSNYVINREKFLAILEQFKGDIPYLHQLFTKVKDLLPEEYVKQLIADLYHEIVYDDEHFIATHHMFKERKHYFKTFDELFEFLVDKQLEKEDKLKKNKVLIAMDTPFPISGYTIQHIKKNSKE